MTVRWVADGQVLQTGARFRGMGQYSLELLAALDSSGQVDLEVVLSRHFDVDEPVRTLAARAPGARISILDLRPDTPGDPRVAAHNGAVLDAHLAGSGAADPVRFLLLSAMEGTTRPAWPTASRVPRWVLVYDLIPLLLHDAYLRDPLLRLQYDDRLGTLLEADGYLTISRTVANDLTMYLGIDPGRLVDIGGAPIPHGPAGAAAPDLDGPFVLLPTGNDRRKNNRRAVRAFGRFNADRGQRFRLIVTSTFSADEQGALQALAPGVSFTGNLPGGQLADLFARAAVVLFPPEYEGLGLPILEAIEYGTPVACSDIPVFREISPDGFAFFDPESILGMADALGRALHDGPMPPDDRARVLARYTWPGVARAVLAGTARTPAKAAARPAVTLVGPAFGRDDRAGRVLQDVFPELTRVADVDLVIDSDGPRGPRYGYLAGIAAARPLRAGVTLGADRVPVYLLSNSPAAARTLFLALGRPGIVVLLDASMDRAWRAAVDLGLISASRNAVEQRLAAVETPGTRHTAALLAVSRAVVVGTESHRRQLSEVADRLDRPDRVRLLPLPTSSLAFPELLPPKDRAVAVGHHLPDRLNPEFRERAALARSVVAVLVEPDALAAVRALSYRALPATYPDADLGLPGDLTVTWTGTPESGDPAGVGPTPRQRRGGRAGPPAGRRSTPPPGVRRRARCIGRVAPAGSGARMTAAGPLRLAVLLDPPDEGAPSMDLAGEGLLGGLAACPDRVTPTGLRPAMPRLARALPGIGVRHAALNADRMVARFGTAEALALRIRRNFDLFHVVDHVYAHLVRALPAGRVGVYCHDLDAFRTVLDPPRHPAPAWFRAMTRATLGGVERAAVVFHSTMAVRSELVAHAVVDPQRLVWAPYGVSPEFRPEPALGDTSAQVLAGLGGRPYLLHVGSALPRKRLDVLIDVFAAVRQTHPELRLVQQGARLTPELCERIDRLGIAGAILQPGPLDRATLAGLYRGAAALLVTSDAEGFGLPVIEALACGAPVLASDIPALREVGADACRYLPVAAVATWAQAVGELLEDGSGVPPRAARLARADGFSWASHARTILDAYLALARS